MDTFFLGGVANTQGFNREMIFLFIAAMICAIPYTDFGLEDTRICQVSSGLLPKKNYEI